MVSMASQLRNRKWSRDEYIVSTDSSLASAKALNVVFDSPAMHWAKPIPDSVMEETLQNSLFFGLYRTHSGNVSDSEEGTQTSDVPAPGGAVGDQTPKLDMVGCARCITDFTTFLYLTDVWVDSRDQGKGLGKWLISCVQETIESMPYLRRNMLFTGDWGQSVPFYEKLMGMTVLETQRGTGVAIMERKGPGNPV
ncbi:GNAT family N-acetyltransferase [Seiridium cupressi]